jgi:hypothetical protein
MGSVSVAQPMGRHVAGQAGASRSSLHDAVHGRCVQVAPALRHEHGRILASVATQRHQRAPLARGQQDDARLAALAVDRRLPGIVTRHQVTPRQAAHFRDTWMTGDWTLRQRLAALARFLPIFERVSTGS